MISATRARRNAPNAASTVDMTQFPNGACVITERLPGAETVALGIWLLGGSNDERDGEQGFAHLLEHLRFRPRDGITDRIAALGGHVNAHCGAELSFVHAFVRREDAGAAVALLWEMLALADLTETDIARERRAIEREHALDHDDPDAMIEQAACALAWRAQGSTAVAGDRRPAGPTAAAIGDYAQRMLCGARVAVIAAGAVDHRALVDGCAALSGLPAGAPPEAPVPVFTPGSFRRTGGVHEARLLWLFEACGARGPSHAVWSCLDRLLRARLERQLRDANGSVYALHTHAESFRTHGQWLVRAACAPDEADACVEQTEEVLRDFAARGPDAREVAAALAAQRVEHALHAGDPRACLARLAHATLVAGPQSDAGDKLSNAAITPALLAETWRAALPRALRLRWLPG